ncbi:hypothetical protein MHU86_22431 [Fragilaria crotonensis]|nr:hypothetical protein MHU86_22431 [Fragilaria crotonensis]
MSWTQAVDRMLTHRHAFVTTRDLETTLGRFSHAAYVIPYARHFMGRLYKACERSKQAGKARLTKPQLDDLILWKAFLQKASRGISINRLVCRWPTRIVRVDACPQGIGGYCLKSGLAWRYQLPEHLLGRATLNTLEFLAAFVGMIVEFHEGAAWTDEDVLLSQETAPQQRDGLLKLQDHPFAASPYFADWRLAAAAAQTQLLPTQPVPSAIAAGAVTKDSSDESTESEEPFLKDSDEAKAERSPASPPPFGTDGFAPDNLRKLAMDPCPVPFVPPSTVTYPTAGAAVRGDSKGSILGKKRDGHRYWTTCGGRVLFRHEVVRIFRCRKPTDDISDQSGRRSFPTEGTGPADNRPRTTGECRHRVDHLPATKNGDKGATVTQHRNDRQGQTDICPVRVLADLTTRVRSYDCHSRTNPKINAVRTQDSDEPQHISSKSILRQLRMATTRREERLGLQASGIGTHSIRSGAAMAMHLAGVPSETIQMVGWRSQTFMRYLRIQVPDSTLE